MLLSINKLFKCFLFAPLQFKTPEEDVSEDVICGSIVVLQYWLYVLYYHSLEL